VPANGQYDLKLTLHDALSAGVQLGAPLTNSATAVSNGLFTVTLDFGADVFTGGARWLETAVRTNGAVDFTVLVPRQELTPTPYAQFAPQAGAAATATTASAVSWAGLTDLPAGLADGVDNDTTYSAGVGLALTDTVFSLNTAFTDTRYWRLGGNAATTPGTQFLGTTDNQPLELKINGLRALRLEPVAESPNVVIGHSGNAVTVGVGGATFGGGGNLTEPNLVRSRFGTISGGVGNAVSTDSGGTTIGGGWLNIIGPSSSYATVGGGSHNTAGAVSATVAGGFGNDALGQDSVVGGGYTNSAASPSSVVAGGYRNRIEPGYSGGVIGGGTGNRVATPGYSFVGGGVNNSIGSSSTNAFIGGGRDNVIQTLAPESVIVGGVDNVIVSTQRSAFIGGGARNEIRVDNQHAVIVGGRDNRIGTNTVTSLVVGGGENHMADNVDGGLMVGGFRNDILGSPNPNRREIAPILIGGSDNEIGRESSWTVILGGDNNRIGTNCASAIVVGGTNNLVADNCMNSFAAGRRCCVNHAGAFMWADSQNASFASAGVNTFNIRAGGGVHLSGDSSQFFGSSVRQMLNLGGTEYGIGIQSSTHYSRTSTGGSFSWVAGGTHSNNANSPGAGGTEMMRLNSGGLRVNGTFVSASDRNQKANFQPVDPREMLEKVAALPIAEWSFKQDAETRHVGPMAQDFHAAFGLGTDDKHIATVDADGVALAAIQGLNQKLEQQNAALEKRVAELTKLVASLAEQVNGRGR
jgi:hypothetical protein